MKKEAKHKLDVVIASNEDLRWGAISSALHEYGFKTHLVRDMDNLLEKVHRPATEVVFLDSSFCSDSLSIIETYKRWEIPRWIYCHRGGSTMADRQKALKAGSYLVLDDPRDPAAYLLRSKQASRYSAVFQGAHSGRNARPQVAGQEDRSEISLPKGLQYKEAAGASFATKRWKKSFHRVLTRPKSTTRELTADSQEVLRSLSRESLGSQLKLLSLRTRGPDDRDHSKVRTLSSSHAETSLNEVHSTENSPDIYWAARSGKAVVVPDSEECKGVDQRGSFGSFASIPIMTEEKQVDGILRVAFPSKLEDYSHAFIEDLMSFSPHLRSMFKKLDFFARIYSGSPIYESVS